MQASFRLGQIAGTTIGVHYTWLLGALFGAVLFVVLGLRGFLSNIPNCWAFSALQHRQQVFLLAAPVPDG